MSESVTTVANEVCKTMRYVTTDVNELLLDHQISSFCTEISVFFSFFQLMFISELLFFMFSSHVIVELSISCCMVSFKDTLNKHI